jgi:hypothetical protein
MCFWTVRSCQRRNALATVYTCAVRTVGDMPERDLIRVADYTLLLHALSVALHSEVVDRIGADKRWRRSRLVFLERHGVSTKTGTWPCD